MSAWPALCLALAVLGGARGLLTRECYSCMSKSMEFHWEHLGRVWQRPLNFSTRCDAPMREDGMGTVRCPTVCLTISEEIFMSGTYTGRNYIRGCMSSLARWGFRNSSIRIFERYDICKEVNRQDLLLSQVSDAGTFFVCSCYGDRCNGVRTSAAPDPRLPHLHLLLFLLALLALR